MRSPQGYGVITDPSVGMIEYDTITCNHCQRIVPIKPMCDAADAGGFCTVCSKHICAGCHSNMLKGNGCTPWEKQMEQIEKRDRALRSYGL